MFRPFFIWICLSLTWYAITHAAIDHAHFADSVLTSPTDKPETLTTPLGRVTTTTYDERLLVDNIEEPSGQTTTFSYYDDGLLQQTVDPTGTKAYTYDSKGRLATVTEGTDVISRSYDELDRIQSFTDSQGNTIGYEFDGGGNLTTLSYPNSKGDVTYAYDNAGRLLTVTDWASRITEFIYDSNSRLSEIRYPNGITCTFEYDSVGRLSRQADTRTSDQTVILDQNFTYDALNRIVEETVLPEPAMYAIPATLMTYDDDDRLASWQSDGTNIIPIFDLDGNMTTGPLEGASQAYIYDSRNRLIQAGTAVYEYDAEDRRISKTENGVTTSFIHNPHAAYSQMLQSTDGSTTTTYVYAGGKLLYEETSGQIQVYHFDSRGSTRTITDSSGTVTNRFSYGIYAELVASMSTPYTPFLYNGAYGVQTDDNGLLHMRARYYSTELRRFINADPIGFGGGMNWYAYANGNPVMLMDPFGLCAEKWYDREIIPGSSLADMGMDASSGAYGLLRSPYDLVVGTFQSVQGIGAYLGYLSVDPRDTLDATATALKALPQTIPIALGEFSRDPQAIGSAVGQFGLGMGAAKVIKSFRTPKTKTILGNGTDVAPFRGQPGYNVLDMNRTLPLDTRKKINVGWLDEAIDRGDDIILKTDPIEWDRFMREIGKESFYNEVELPRLMERGVINDVILDY